jgi:hypothetical protein
MPFLKASDHRALAWYAETFKLKLQMSTPPIIYFKNEAGKEVRGDLFSILNLHKAHKEENKGKKKVKA